MNKIRTIAITSGKGGVGKTTLTANIAFSLALKGKRVLIFDGDLGMANVDIFFGVKPNGNISEVLSGDRQISEILTPLTPNISLIPGGSGLTNLNRLNAFERRNLIEAVASLEHQYDYMLIDTAPGISDNVLHLNSAAQVSGVVITPDPASLADSYALIKVLHQEYRENKFAIICNMVNSEVEGLSLFNRFNEIVNRFLFIGLDYWGAIAQDALFRKSTQAQRLIVRHEPQSTSALAIEAVVKKMERKTQILDPKTGIQFFWEQAVGVA
jgi:flagellar biosynthesis protein FlhG